MLAGANQIYAGTGHNPRDKVIDTSKGRGFTVAECRQLLREAGFIPRMRATPALQGPPIEGKVKKKNH